MGGTADALDSGGVHPEHAASPATLTLRQRTLLEVLSERWPSLAPIYLGAICAHQQAGNPDRLPQAAHCLRELMTLLPPELGVAAPEHNRSIRSELRNLHQVWRDRRVRTRTFVEGQWVGEIDGHARRMLVAGDAFFGWYEDSFPTRIREVEAVLRALDPERQLPLASAVGIWSDLREYFIEVAHHRPDVDADVFDDRLDELEDFLLTRLRPRPFADAARIDSLIEAGEQDADR